MVSALDPTLRKYLDEARRAAEAVVENEPVLLAAARSGNGEARHALTRAYLFRAAEIGLRLAPEGMAQLDAVQAANTVLLRLVTQGPEPGIADYLEPAIKAHFGEPL